MSCLARCLKPLIRFSVYQSEVMLLQRALTAIEKQPRFTKSSRMTFFFRLNTLAEEHAHVQCPCHLVLLFFPTRHQLGASDLMFFPSLSIWCCAKAKMWDKTKLQTALAQSPSLSFNRKKTNVFFCIPKKKKKHFPNYDSQCDSLYLQLNPQVPVIQFKSLKMETGQRKKEKEKSLTAVPWIIGLAVPKPTS